MNSSCFLRQSLFLASAAAEAAVGAFVVEAPEMDFLLAPAPTFFLRTYFSASVPSTRCLVVSKTFRFLVLVFWQISRCLAILSSAKFRAQMVHRARPSGMGPSGIGRLGAEVADGFRLGMAVVVAIVDLPVDARDAVDLAELDRGVAVGLLDGDDCAAAAELTGVFFLGAGFVAVVEVEGVLPGTGFSLRLFTFCC